MDKAGNRDSQANKGKAVAAVSKDKTARQMEWAIEWLEWSAIPTAAAIARAAR